MSERISVGNYAELKSIALSHGLLPLILEVGGSHFSVNLQLHDSSFHRHILKGTAEATVFLADFWPATDSMLFDYGNYTLGTTARTFANRKTIVMMAPQKSQNLTVASVTSSSITFAANTLIRKTLTSALVLGANQLTVASTSNLWVGMRVKLIEAAKLDTNTYVEKIINSTTVQISQVAMDTYTTACVMYQDFDGRYVITNPTESIQRFRVVTYSNDTLNINTMGMDLTTLIAANDTVRMSKEVCRMNQWLLSGTSDYLVVSEVCMPMFYGDSLEHLMGRYLLRTKGEIMEVPLVLDGAYGDYVVVRGYDLGNTSPQAFCTLAATIHA